MANTNNAHEIADTLTSAGFIAKVWEGETSTRVYVKRHLSRKLQDMGYIEVPECGELNYRGLTRNQAGIRQIVEA